MRIVHILFNLKLGGTETMLLDIMSEQAKLGHNVTLLLINNSHDAELLNRIDKNVSIKQIGRRDGSKNPWHIIKLNYTIGKLRPDAIHVHNVKALGMIFTPQKKNIIFTAHCIGISNHLVKKARKICAISKAVRDDIKRHHNIDAIVVYNGIDVKSIKKSPKRLHERFKIVQVGRMYAETKGQDILITAVAKLKSEGISDISIDFIGDGASANAMKNLAKKLDISNQTNFLGACPRSYIYEHLCGYNLLVQPSRDEGFGLTIAEAMAAKVPTLASNLPAISELLVNGKYGNLFSLGSNEVENCASGILEIKNNYARYKNRANEEAFEYVASTFDISTVARNYVTQYNN